MSETTQRGGPVPTGAATPPAACTPFSPTSVGRYHHEAPRASVGEVCRTLGAIAVAITRARGESARDEAARARGAPTTGAAHRRDELARLRAEARAAVTGLVFRLRADDVPLDRVLAIVRSAARDALPGSLMPQEARAITADAARWSAEAYAVAD